MKREKITLLTVFGTRPEVIKLYPLLERLKQSREFQNIIISTSQHREMIDDLLELFSLKPDQDLNIIKPNQSLGEITKKVFSRLCPYLKKYRPDMVLVQGDTTTAFVGALASFYQRIPVGHIEAGLRSFNNYHPYPEEVNRRLISIVSELHFAPTTQNAENLYREGVGRSRVFITGNTVVDSLKLILQRKKSRLEKFLPLETFNSQRVILVTSHRRENWGKPLEDLCQALVEIVRTYPDVDVVYPLHLNPKVRKTVLSILDNQPGIKILDPLPYEAFVEAMDKAHFIITDSGGVQEEAASLGKPTLVFRKVTERQEAVACGAVKVIGFEKEQVIEEASRLLEDSSICRGMMNKGNPFGDGKASQRIVQAILHFFGRGERPRDWERRE